MGTNEKLSVNIHVDQLMDAIASNCTNLERLELRYGSRLNNLKYATDRVKNFINSILQMGPREFAFLR